MKSEVNIRAEMITWAINRSGKSLDELASKALRIHDWLNATKKPTFKQLETFSKKVHVPFGYLLLDRPPVEILPIPYFRTSKVGMQKVSLEVSDTISLLQQRQDWLKDYFLENDFKNKDYVGSYRNSTNIIDIVRNIMVTLGLNQNWAQAFRTFEEALIHLAQKIEDIGVTIIFNGVVENNTSRPINVEECRGFVLVDEIAPFMFINNADGKAAQLFTIVHELAHIWLGHSAGFDIEKIMPANDPVELLCDKIAAEFLVPESLLNNYWITTPIIKNAAKHFKVSEIVLARRALDLNKITKDTFFEFYDEYSQREFLIKRERSGGGDFYSTSKKRLSLSFVAHVNNALKGDQILHREAYKLTSLRGKTYDEFIKKYLVR